MIPVFLRNLRESWSGLIAWSAGLAATLLLYLPLYPSMAASDDLQRLIDSLPAQLVSALGYEQIATGAGYTESTFYGLMGFLLLTIAAVAAGSSALAGEWESGRLELDLAHGIGRMPYTLGVAAAVLVRLLWLGLFSGLVVWALDEPSELGLQPGRIVGATLAVVGLAFLSAAVALLAGALTGRRSAAVGAGAGIAVFGYATHAVAGQSGDLEWLYLVSPYSWALRQQPLVDGPDAAIGLVWLLAAACVVASALTLSRRDLT